MLDQCFTDAKTVLERMQPGRTPANPDYYTPSSVLDCAEMVARTPLAFLREDLSERTLLRLPDQERREIYRHFTKLGRTACRLARIGGIDLPGYDFGSGTLSLAMPLAHNCGHAQVVALLKPRGTSMQQACELAREILEAFVLLEPPFNATRLEQGRVRYFESNLRAGLPGFLRMFP